MRRLVVTKYCTATVRDYMLSGNFRMTSLAECAANDFAGAAMSDHGEGVGNALLFGDLHDFTGNIGGIIAHGLTIEGSDPAPAVQFNVVMEANVFCTSNGKFRRDVYNFIRYGNNRDYDGNNDYNSYVTFDAQLLGEALGILHQMVYGAYFRFWMAPVRYVGREEKFSIDGYDAGREQEIIRHGLNAAFRKPTRFSGEQEFRFLFPCPPDVPAKPIFTSDGNWDIAAIFREAVLDQGCIEP